MLEFDVNAALRTYISNNGINPENFESGEIEKYGFHSTSECRVGSGPYPSWDHIEKAEKIRSNLGAGNRPEWFHILALHVIREHEVGEFGAEFTYFMDYHLAELLAKGVITG